MQPGHGGDSRSTKSYTAQATRFVSRINRTLEILKENLKGVVRRLATAGFRSSLITHSLILRTCILQLKSYVTMQGAESHIQSSRNITASAISNQRASVALDGSPAQCEVELRRYHSDRQAAVTICIDAAKIFLGRNESAHPEPQDHLVCVVRARLRREEYYASASA